MQSFLLAWPLQALNAERALWPQARHLKARLEFRVSGLGFMVSGVGLRVSDLGFGVYGLGFRVYGFRCRV